MEQNETTVESTHEIESTEPTEEVAEEQTEAVEEEKDWKAEAAKWRRLAQKKEKKDAPQSKLLENKESPSKPVLADEIEARVDLRLEGYSKEEIDQISKVARAEGISLLEAKEIPLIKKGIESLRTERKATDGTPSPSKRGIVFKGKTFGEVIADSKATDADKQAAFEARLGRVRGGNASI